LDEEAAHHIHITFELMIPTFDWFKKMCPRTHGWYNLAVSKLISERVSQ